jgi:hypothetical protein
MSLLLATSILALGGVGLYMYKSSDHEYNGSDDSSYDEDNLFGGSRSFWGSNEDDEDDNEYKNFQEEAEPQPEPEPKVRARGGKTKTKRNSRNVGSKRRY